MSPQLLAMALAPLLGLFIVSLGNGLLSSITTLRLDAAGASALQIGWVSSAYFIGLALGSFFNDRLILRVGHIRAYSCFASMIAATVLLQGLGSDISAWFVLRLINGWACVGVYLVIESWLLLASDPKSRGRVLAVYMIALYGSGMFGQAAIGLVSGLGDSAPFLIIGTLASLSVMPVVMIPRVTPLVERVDALSPRQLLRVTPTGVMGCFGSGVAIAAVYTLLPLYLKHLGMGLGQVGQMMAWVILGAMVLQYPVGRWSDRQDRQSVLIVLCTACLVLSLVIMALPPSSLGLGAALFLLGGAIFAIYPVAVSHSADRAPAGAVVPMIQGLLLINSLGSALSPLAVGQLMAKVGENGLFWAFALLNLVMLAYFGWCRTQRSAPHAAAPFAAAAQMSPTGVELRVTQDLQAAMDEAAGDVEAASKAA
ncbi:MFS transporter [Pseudomonas eucalypticola]|uniref:MFS transporter n=1 Tax=Pseudomonas eucalypticola TaxID=2599595 RepID=A0A7D5D6Z8_9PSED|nr:MFS transporter [Pseudomonas eucalypticola]QKZ04500.1 MFS transporter [Pseudomonas eucalypticola]